MSQLPEEIEAMAWIYGQSQAIDSMMTERNSQLVTDSNTIKRQISEYQKHSRGNQPQPQATYIPPPHPMVANPPIPQIEHNITPHFEYLPQPITQSGDLQLEFNMEPTKMDDVINILKEINIKLGKILNNQNESKNKTEKESITKLPQRLK
jgi:hypothetical protein